MTRGVFLCVIEFPVRHTDFLSFDTDLTTFLLFAKL